MTQIVLVDQTRKIDPALLHTAAIALNLQVSRDLPSAWTDVSATVGVAPSLQAIPHGAWPVFLVHSLPPGEGGYHMDKHNQPYAKVIATPDDASWTIDASHEIIEMLVDPFGNRMHSSQAIKISGDGVVDTDGLFNYLVEACDPCEANNFAYDIGGIAVSDFITPRFYDASVTPGVNYSFKGNIKRPRELLKGGYISYVDSSGAWQQILWVDPGDPVYNNLAVKAGARSMRLSVHQLMGDALDKAKHLQRRKADGLPQSVKQRVEIYRKYRSGAAKERELETWYAL